MYSDVIITSAQNPRIKRLQKLLDKPAERRKENLVVIEGERECERAVSAGWKFKEVYWCAEKISSGRIKEIFSNPSTELVEVNAYVFEKIAQRDSTHGIVGIAVTQNTSLDSLAEKSNPFYLVVEGVEKPGNLGAILRTASAAGVDAVFVCDPRTDIYNPGVIRSSTGAIFSLPVIQITSESCLLFLKEKKIPVSAALVNGTKTYFEINWKGAAAMVFGTEDKGLSAFWQDACDNKVTIPMHGEMDSLNLSVSVAIMAFEAAKQRR